MERSAEAPEEVFATTRTTAQEEVLGNGQHLSNVIDAAGLAFAASGAAVCRLFRDTFAEKLVDFVKLVELDDMRVTAPPDRVMVLDTPATSLTTEASVNDGSVLERCAHWREFM